MKQCTLKISIIGLIILSVCNTFLMYPNNNTKASALNDPGVVQNVNQLPANENNQIDQLISKNHFIGTVLIYKNGTTIYQTGKGYANYRRHIKNSAASLFQWGSVEKSLTAVLIMKQVELGKLSLSDHLNKFYPSIKGSNQITIRQMLNMTSGLTMAVQQMIPRRKDHSIVDFARTHAVFNHKQQGQEDYQPVNYVLLTGILETLSHETYTQMVQNEIIKPLNLKYMGFMPNFMDKPTHTISYQSLAKAPASYKAPIPITQISYNRELGTGNIYSTVGDLLNVQVAIIQGKIILPASLQILRNTSNGDYGGGTYNYPDHIFSHGLILGYETTVHLNNDGNNGVILMSNRSLYNMTTPKTINFITSIYNDTIVH